MSVFYDDGQAMFHLGDVRAVLREMPAGSVHCVVTSPPYWGLRDYGCDGQLGLESTPEAYVAAMVGVFREVKRVLRDDGTLWLNIGDTYNGAKTGNTNGQGVSTLGAWKNGGRREPDEVRSGNKLLVTGLKPKDLVGIPWMLAFALRADGWWLRQDIIWAKPNPMPESVTDRCTKAHEYLFLLSKSERYWYDGAAIRENFADDRMGDPGQYNRQSQASKGANNSRQDLGFLNEGAGWTRGAELGGRNKRSVWTVATEPFPEAHFATFPSELIKPCILAGCPEGGTVLDPFIGSGTTALVAKQLGRRAIGIDLNADYLAMAVNRCRQLSMDLPVAALGERE